MKLKTLTTAIFLLSTTAVFSAQADTSKPAEETKVMSEKKNNDYEKMVIGKVWVTTQALDQDKKDVPATNDQVANFFGLAEYFPDGTFKMLTLDGNPKMQGDWSFSDDGKSRTLAAKNDKGEVLFTRVVENVTVTPDEYTYRIYPSAENKTKYFDIIHKVKK